MISKEEEKKDVENKKSKQLNDDKIASSLCRFDIYTQPFITGIVKERFDMCQVGDICLKSLSIVNVVENERRTTQYGNVRVLSFLVSICLLHSP